MADTEKASINETDDNTKLDGKPPDELEANSSFCFREDVTEAIQKTRNVEDEANNETSKEINSLESFYSWYKEKIKLLNDLNEVMPPGNKFKLFFRGEEDNTYKLVPSIYRNGWITNEHRFFNESVNRCPESFKECKTAFEKLAQMQHYRVPTRLLDITENPLIALYFATEKGKNQNNGRFYCFFVSESAIKYPDDDITAILANAATIEIKKFYDGEYYDNALKFTRKFEEYANAENFDIQCKLYREAKQILIKAPLINEILMKSQNDCGYCSSRYTFDDLAQILCVKPKINNWRISNQNSAFLLFGFLFDKNYPLPLQNLRQCLKFIELLLIKYYDPKRREFEDSIIFQLPLDNEILKQITAIKENFRLVFDASERKRALSREITKEKARLFSALLEDAKNIRFNTHSGLSTGRHFHEINKTLPSFWILKFFYNLIYKSEPLVFFDSIETSFKAKDDISVELSRIGISNDFIFPELENVSQILCYKYERKQPIILEKIDDKLVIMHLSDYAQKNSGLQEGDVILDFNSQEDFLNRFTLSECVPVTVLRKISSTTSTIENYSNDFKGNNESDASKDMVKRLSLDVLFNQISSDDNPLFANDSDGTISN